MMHRMHPRNRDLSDGLAARACPRHRLCGRRDALQLRRRRRRRRRRCGPLPTRWVVSWTQCSSFVARPLEWFRFLEIQPYL